MSGNLLKRGRKCVPLYLIYFLSIRFSSIRGVETNLVLDFLPFVKKLLNYILRSAVIYDVLSGIFGLLSPFQ